MTRDKLVAAFAVIVVCDCDAADAALPAEADAALQKFAAAIAPAQKWLDDLAAATAPAVAAVAQLTALGEEIAARFDATFRPMRFEVPPEILEHLR